MQHALKVVKLLGRQNINLSGKQINAVIDMLEKEEMLEVEADIEKVLVQSPTDGDAAGSGSDIGEQPQHIKEMFSSDTNNGTESEDGQKRARMQADHDKKNGPINLK